MHRVLWLVVVAVIGLAGCSTTNISFLTPATPTPAPTPTALPTPVVVINCQPTPGRFGGGILDEYPSTSELAPPDMPGDRMKITGTIYASDCVTPLAGAIIQVRHADSEGNYDRTPPFDLVGQIQADEAGRYEFSSIRPSGYRAGGASRPAHIHTRVTANDGRVLVTEMLFADDPLLQGADVPPAIVIELVEQDEADGPMLYGTFNIVLPVAPPTPEIINDEDL